MFLFPKQITLYGHSIGAPSFSGRGGGGQDRARGRHLTNANTLSAFWPAWGGGGAVRFCSIQSVGGAHVC